MKPTNIIFILFLAFSTAIGLTACSDMQAEGNANADLPVHTVQQIEIPTLLSRADGLGTPDEIAHVSSIYDAQVARLRQDAADAEARLKLAELFINEARITGEHPYYYPQALNMLNQIPDSSYKGSDQRFRALYLKASVQLSLHDFAAAYATGEQARQIFPYNAGVYGVLVDAKVELGDYDRAVELCDRMVGMRPDLRSYARVSYLREIHGEVEGAIEAMEMAVAAGVPGYEQTAWCRLNLAQLEATYGDPLAARMHYELLLQERPNYPFAYAGLARMAMDAGDYAQADSLLDRAIGLIPEVGFYEDKAELLELMGATDQAMALYPEILAMMAEDAEAGHNMDLEMAQVHLRIGKDAEKALDMALKAREGRPNNIEVNGVLAEIYLALNEKESAQMCLDKALATGSQHPDYLKLKAQL